MPKRCCLASELDSHDSLCSCSVAVGLMMKKHLIIETAFELTEQCFDELSLALLSGEPVTLAESSEKLQRAAFELSLHLSRLAVADPNAKVFKERLRLLASGLSSRRESLIRRTVLIDRALNALVPATVRNTYGAKTKTYAAVGTQTGSFKFLAA
jgi:hypothetical protein